jgi:hypothetical protein
LQAVPRLVKEQCEVRGCPTEWVVDEDFNLQLAVVDKKIRSQLLPLVSQPQLGAVGLSVGDVRVRMSEISEQKQKCECCST